MGQVCPKAKGYFPSKTEKVKIAIEFSMFELVYMPSFTLNRQFWFIEPNLPKKVIFGAKQKRGRSLWWTTWATGKVDNTFKTLKFSKKLKRHLMWAKFSLSLVKFGKCFLKTWFSLVKVFKLYLDL